jgi:hypothetical protein
MTLMPKASRLPAEWAEQRAFSLKIANAGGHARALAPALITPGTRRSSLDCAKK